jgi:hypothetical protein
MGMGMRTTVERDMTAGYVAKDFIHCPNAVPAAAPAAAAGGL